MTTARGGLRERALTIPAALLLLVGLAACGGSDDEGGLSVSEAWVKASEGGSTAAFGILANSSDEDLTVVSAETSASDRTELHEVVMKDGEMVMQQKQDGIGVPAGGEHTLEPGGDHIMVLDLSTPILPGEDVELTLTMDNGATYDYTAQVKETEGGDEPYHDDGDGADDEQMDMG